MPRRAARTPSIQGAQQAGFSIIELVIAMGLLLLLLLVAADLFLESARLLNHTSRRARDARPEFAAQVLQTDLRSAASASSSVGTWSTTPLGLTRPDGTTVVWWVDGTQQLQRSQNGPGSERIFLDRVTSWRWRRIGTRLIEVEVSASLEGGEAFLRQAANPSLRKASPRDARIRTLVALRGGGGSGW